MMFVTFKLIRHNSPQNYISKFLDKGLSKAEIVEELDKK